ncbi:hypothetical protein [Luteococcus japonicus]|uniref:hypothetical protein n=1 Tax=Luteococcus japonicus TaxID=33984 RepID=UPI000B9C0912|nr:hypothetical protein [Luteococcus japonicus]
MRKLVLLVALGCAVTACSPSEPAPTGAPTPTLAGTPSVDPSTDPLYLEAVDVYKKFQSELSRAELSGFEPKSLSPSIDAYATGTLKEAVEATYQADRQSGFILKGNPDASTLAFSPNPGASKAGSSIALRACVDASALQVVERNSGKISGKGTLTYKEIFFKEFDGKLKAFAQESREVDKCPIS